MTDFNREMELKAKLPWPQPQGIYVDDGPTSLVEFDLEEARLQVEPTGRSSLTTGRKLYKVKCLTCKEIVRGATTSASIHCVRHVLSVAHQKV